MRIASLVPSSTEMLFALGLGDSVVGVTHECDFPPQATGLAHLTRSVIEEGLPASDIDAAVRERTATGQALYELDETLLVKLAPDLIVTQAVCEVCAVSYDEVVAAAERLPSPAEVLSLDPSTLGDVFGDIPRLADKVGVPEAGAALSDQATERIEAVADALKSADAPRVAALEWLDPLFVGGHWVPEMIEAAGGQDVLGMPGERSRTAEWSEVQAARPEVVVSMPCGYGTAQASRETLAAQKHLMRLEARVAAVDASSYFSRPGPRLVDGIELLAHLLHPELVPTPPPNRAEWLDLQRGSEVS